MPFKVLICQRESRLSEELYEDWCEEAVQDGFCPCESAGTSPWHCTNKKAELRRQMTAAARRKSRCRHLSSRISTIWSLRRTPKTWRKHIFEVPTRRQVKGSAGAVMIHSLFDDTDPFLFEVLNTDYVRTSVYLFFSLFEELNTEQDQGSCERCTA